MTRKYKYELAKATLCDALEDLRILSGDTVGPPDASWQDVAGTAACNLRVLAGLLDEARTMLYGDPPVFPSPEDCGDE